MYRLTIIDKFCAISWFLRTCISKSKTRFNVNSRCIKKRINLQMLIIEIHCRLRLKCNYTGCLKNISIYCTVIQARVIEHFFMLYCDGDYWCGHRLARLNTKMFVNHPVSNALKCNVRS